MRNLGFLLTLSFTILFTSCKPAAEYEKNQDGTITWLDINKAAELANSSEKMYFVDVYTDWCHWCKVMDKKTFTDPTVIEFMEQNFHNVKFNAEQTDMVTWNNTEYTYKPGGRRGIHGLAPLLLKNRLSYPSFAILDKDRNPIKVIVGYKKPDQLMAVLEPMIKKS